jgi:actin-like ATPase involved in cell morphogenesis
LKLGAVEKNKKNQNEQFEIEYKKVGEELEETVEEIIEEVKKMEEKYK